jgi:MFS family permease
VNRSATVGVLVLAAAVGLLLSLYGPAIPELRDAYGVGGGGSALVLSAHFAGAITGIGWWGLERRLAARTWLVVAVVLLVCGAAGIAFAPAWPVVLVAAFGVGVGFGVVVVEINVLFADGFGERAAAMLNLLGACFGAGAVLGPLAVAATGGYRFPFCAGALLAVASLALTRDLPRTATPPPGPGQDRPPLGIVAGFVVLCALYVGVESGIGGFEVTSLRAAGLGAAAAASWTAGYWAALTAGRLLAIPLAAGRPAGAGRRLAGAGRGRARPGPPAGARPGRLHPGRPGPWAGVPDRTGLAGPGGSGRPRADGHGVRRRQPRWGGAPGGDRPAGRRQLAGRDPDHRPRHRPRLPGRDRGPAPVGWRPAGSSEPQPDRRSWAIAR